jgi:uncharacterized membrane protein
MFLTFLFILMMLFIGLIFIGIAGAAFQKIGFTQSEFSLILVGTLLGSFVNIPVYKMKRMQRVVDFTQVRVFWVTYRVPQVSVKEVPTTVAINVGGAIIPVLVSGYILLEHQQILVSAFVGVIVASLIVHMVARKVKGVGVVTPALLPPFAAAIIAILVSPSFPAMVAYVSGTLGALIGADLTNLRGMQDMEASMISIGGAGTFDGVFLTGLVAIILVSIL